MILVALLLIAIVIILAPFAIGIVGIGFGVTIGGMYLYKYLKKYNFNKIESIGLYTLILIGIGLIISIF